MTEEPSGEVEGDAPVETPEVPPLPLLELRDGLSEVIDTEEGLAEAAAAIALGTGPVAIDAERASGYRYSARAYLVQLRREGAGTFLIDPIPFDDLSSINAAIGDAEWILHAATQDLVCLREVGLVPHSLFDTEHAARLLGYPRVGLATLVETLIERRMRKEHSAADWSQRPLPASWLEYAALDVEVLLELREMLAAELDESGKREWADQEFASLLNFQPAEREDPWRRTSGIHRLRQRRTLAAVRELWLTRDRLAEREDTTPGRLLPDASIIVAAKAMPGSRSSLLSTQGFHGRASRRFASEWADAIQRAREMDEADLPPSALRSEGPPQPRSWADRDPEAALRLTTARDALTALSEEVSTPLENLLTPSVMRKLLWSPPGEGSLAEVEAELRALGAREWQIGLTAPILADAVASARAAS